MRVLLAHNRYQLAGGEDVVFEAEGRLLESRGHEVVRYVVDNDDLTAMPAWRSGPAALWNRRTYREVASLCGDRKPDVAHFHNTFPLMSPSGYYAARRCGVPVVQTLHNYRLICPNALLFRGGRVCEDCVGRRFAFPGIRHSCYRGSRGASAAAATTVAFHRFRGTWTGQVDAYVALTEFAKAKFVAGGLPEDRIHVKPNFLEEDPGVGSGEGRYALFVGRLAPEKGLRVLLDAWSQLQGRLPLKIVGTGPEEEYVRARAAEIVGVEALGRLDKADLNRVTASAAFLVFPSTWYEPFGLTVIEALATGLPVVASAHGSGAELVEDGVTGALFRPGDAGDLAAKVTHLLGEPPLLSAMRPRCRDAYLRRFTAATNYESLMRVYDAAYETFAGRR
jgi:glycosyltransferase involved in cell wall biosynthesis